MLTIYTQEVSLPGPRRGLAALVSFSLQTVGLVLLLMLPLLRPGMLPKLELTPPLVMLTSLPQPPARQPLHTGQGLSNFSGNVLVAPWRIPSGIRLINDHGADPIRDGVSCPGCAILTNGTGATSALSNILAGSTPPPSIHHTPSSAPPRISTPMEAFLVHRVQPEYPRLAILARQQGPVILTAMISKQGTIENLQVVSGPPLLVQAAINAVRQWRYRPFLLNGEPVEVQTQITVIFVLGGN